MTVVEIIVLLVGFVCLYLSLFVSKKMGQGITDSDGASGSAALWTEKEEQMIRDRVTEILEERQSDMVGLTEEQMNRLCNEKIMAIDEFSGQLLGKIEQNQQEVVFMYNLLNEKKNEISKIMAESASRAKAPENRESVSVLPAGEVRQKESRVQQKAPAPQKNVVPMSGQAAVGTVDSRPARPTGASQVRAASASAAKAAAEKKSTGAGARPAPARPAASGRVDDTPVRISRPAASPVRQDHPAEPPEGRFPVAEEEKKEVPKVSGDINLRIQKMYREGKSVLEISKALNMGQGEVKLVIALYGGRR